MSVRRFLKNWDYRVEWGDGPDAPRNEPDNANNSRPVYRKITTKFRPLSPRDNKSELTNSLVAIWYIEDRP